MAIAKTKVDAKSVLTPREIQRLEGLLSINRRLRSLEAQKQKLVEAIKKSMNKRGIDALEIGKFTVTLSKTSRTTVKDVEEFSQKLIKSGYAHLVTTSLKPDVNGVLAEVDAGKLDKDLVERYVQAHPVETLRCIPCQSKD